MIRRKTRLISALGAVVAFAAVAAIDSTPATADSFAFSYGSGHGNRHHHRPAWHNHHRHHHGHPGLAFSYVYAPPPVIYEPPPRVVYVQPPAPVSLIPASPVYQRADGRYCREYQSTVMVGNTVQPSYGTACLMPDGAWRIVN